LPVVVRHDFVDRDVDATMATPGFHPHAVNMLPSYYHLHLISDATGETLTTIAKAASVQYAQRRPIEHVHPLVRTPRQLRMSRRDRWPLQAPLLDPVLSSSILLGDRSASLGSCTNPAGFQTLRRELGEGFEELELPASPPTRTPSLRPASSPSALLIARADLTGQCVTSLPQDF
jgi:hypothetical protein